MHSKVDNFLDKAEMWQAEMRQLRSFLLACGLTEDFKWRQPCYSYDGNNIVILGALKNYCVLGFFKGVLLSDTENLLVSPGKNSQSVKHFKFEHLSSIIALEKVIKSYVFEAIEIEKLGLVVEKKKDVELKYPAELTTFFINSPTFKKAFESLTPGRQRGYLIFFSAAKQSNTRIKRIEKYRDRIIKGMGTNDCVCGASKKMPNCDGSHKYL
jgi:uncharacterized protein YdeI (YjbR/CyaY-like superfamily)